MLSLVNTIWKWFLSPNHVSHELSPDGKPATIFTIKVRATPGNFISLVISPTLNMDFFLLSPEVNSERKKIALMYNGPIPDRLVRERFFLTFISNLLLPFLNFFRGGWSHSHSYTFTPGRCPFAPLWAMLFSRNTWKVFKIIITIVNHSF